jgi:hypothetical protein
MTEQSNQYNSGTNIKTVILELGRFHERFSARDDAKHVLHVGGKRVKVRA